jgi:hypothetical protein
MEDFVDKPEDYDAIIHGETRFVIFEKKEDVWLINLLITLTKYLYY